ncbi:MAG: hypothetical protein QM817_31525 [Archangium sp.]
MNQHRLSRLKRLATGAALISSTLALGEDVKAPPVNPGPPTRMNSPGKQKPVAVDAGVVDAGVTEEPVKPDDGPHVNSPPPQKPIAKPRPPNVNSPPQPTTK